MARKPCVQCGQAQAVRPGGTCNRCFGQGGPAVAKPDAKWVPIAEIKIDGDTQVREKIDGDVVAEYAEAYEANAPMPPAETVFDGTTYWLWDGFHRLHGRRKAGCQDLLCNVRTGTQEDARWFACSANQTHGLRRTNADKRRAVERAISLRPIASDRDIARHVGVADTTVGDHRKRLASTAVIPQLSERMGADGKTRSLPVKPVATAPKEEAPAAILSPPSVIFTCDECGDGFDAEVWHCTVCDHHWPMNREECWNCHKGEQAGSPVATTVEPESEPEDVKTVAMWLEEEPGWTDDDIAERCGVSAATVAKIRADKERESEADDSPSDEQIGEEVDVPAATVAKVREKMEADAVKPPPPPPQAYVDEERKVAASVDCVGLPLQGERAEAFAVVELFKEAQQLRLKLQQKITQIAAMPGGKHLGQRLHLSIRAGKDVMLSHHLEAVAGELKTSMPYAAVCPYCYNDHPGKFDQTCKACMGDGIVPKGTWEAAPQDYRDVLLLALAGKLEEAA